MTSKKDYAQLLKDIVKRCLSYHNYYEASKELRKKSLASERYINELDSFEERLIIETDRTLSNYFEDENEDGDLENIVEHIVYNTFDIRMLLFFVSYSFTLASINSIQNLLPHYDIPSNTVLRSNTDISPVQQFFSHRQPQSD